jgi:CsoR family transcriptional regulator, copper-sensing transcriptional repressor
MTTKKNALKPSIVKETSCPCEPDVPGRKAVGVDTEIKASNLRRLSRIEGQIRGIQRMVEEDRYCADILTQVTSAQEALRAVARALMRESPLSLCYPRHSYRVGGREASNVRRTAGNDLQKCSLTIDSDCRRCSSYCSRGSSIKFQSPSNRYLILKDGPHANYTEQTDC